MKKKLLRKYKGICIYDDEENFTDGIINVEWVKKARSMPSHYAVSVQNFAAIDNADEIYPYMINECLKLHDMIKDCPVDNNNAFSLIPSKKQFVASIIPLCHNLASKDAMPVNYFIQ